MRDTLRSLLRRWTLRLTDFLASCEPPTIRTKTEKRQPNLLRLEGREVPAATYGVTLDPGLTLVSVIDNASVHSTTVTVPNTSPILVGNSLFRDDNNNGAKDAGEINLANFQVQLFDNNGTLLGTATSDASGNFQFRSDAGVSTANTIFNVPLNGGAMYQLRVNYGQNGLTAADLGGVVFTDTNGNGRQDAGELGVSGVTVFILDNNGIVINAQVTNGSGIYTFPNQPLGTYTILVDTQSLPPGSVFTSKDAAGSTDNNDSDVNPATGQTDAIIINGLSAISNVSAGVYTPVSIGDFAFFDANGNGIQDAGEGGQAGVTVNLLNSAGTIVGSQTTDGSGIYLFSVAPGTYQLEFLGLAGSKITLQNQGVDDTLDSDADPITGRTGLAAFNSGDINIDIDAGFTMQAAGTGSIGDFVWFDQNGNGIQDAGEPGLPNATVNLRDTANTLLATTTPNGIGFYQFTGLTAGQYVIEVVPGAGFSITLQGQGADPKLDSDVSQATGLSATITLGAGEVNNDVDAGLFKPVTAFVGDFVWSDTNGNGIQDVGEPGVANVTVNLLDSAGTIISSTMTSNTGIYQFSNLTPGQYQIEFVAPIGQSFTVANQGANDTIDSDADVGTGRSGLFTLVAGQADLTRDAGLVTKPPQLANLGNFVWFDANQNGVQDAGEIGVVNVTVNLLNTSGTVLATTLTDANGGYLFSNIAAGSYVVEFIPPPVGWFFTVPFLGGDPKLDSDADQNTHRTNTIVLAAGETNLDIDAGLTKPLTAVLGDFVWNDLNCNGIQDAGEPGVAGVTVNLLDNNGVVINTMQTNANGGYLFINLAPGSYSVQFVAPAGFIFTMQNAGANDAIDSDADPVTGRTQTVALAGGGSDLTLDGGLCQTAALGDFVWLDTNQNGIQDGGEVGVPNVTVTLLNGATTVATQQTNANGLYLFTGLTPMVAYTVVFTLPAGFAFTLQNQGANDAVDSDANPATGQTGTYTLAPGETNLTVDAGIRQGNAGGLTVNLGDYVWLDTNLNGIQDAGEAGVPNVLVRLLDGTGVMITSQLTDANGLYLFTDLDPGTYQVQFVAPTGLLFTRGNQGANDAVDSDADFLTGLTPLITLTTTDDLTWDAGLIRPASIRGKVYYDINNDGIPQDNEPGIAGAKIVVTGTDMDGNAVTRTVTSGANGWYIFAMLRTGTYTITESQPLNWLDGKDRIGNTGGTPGNDLLSAIPLALDGDFLNYDFGERLGGLSNEGKEQLLASSKQASPTTGSQAATIPQNPSFGNSVAAARFFDAVPHRYVVASTDFGAPPLVRVFDYHLGLAVNTYLAYDAGFRGGVRTAVIDVNGDGTPDVITAPGFSGGPHIKIFDGATAALITEFFAYDASFRGGVYVTAGDVDGDGVPEIITGAGETGGAHVKVFSAAGVLLREFFAYDNFNGGVRIAASDINGDGLVDIITAAGPGGGPHVRVFSGNPAQGVLTEFYAYDAGFRGGVYVSAGDVDGDGQMDIVTGAGAGGRSHVRAFNGTTLAELYSQYAYGSTFTGGVRVGVVDVNGDGKDDIVTTPGAGLASFTQILDVTRTSNLESFLVADPSYLGGAYVSGARSS